MDFTMWLINACDDCKRRGKDTQGCCLRTNACGFETCIKIAQVFTLALPDLLFWLLETSWNGTKPPERKSRVALHSSHLSFLLRSSLLT